MRYIQSSPDFARSEVIAGLFESICLGCHKVLGIAKNLRGLDIVETAHQCPNCAAEAKKSEINLA